MSLVVNHWMYCSLLLLLFWLLSIYSCVWLISVPQHTQLSGFTSFSLLQHFGKNSCFHFSLKTPRLCCWCFVWMEEKWDLWKRGCTHTHTMVTGCSPLKVGQITIRRIRWKALEAAADEADVQCLGPAPLPLSLNVASKSVSLPLIPLASLLHKRQVMNMSLLCNGEKGKHGIIMIPRWKFSSSLGGSYSSVLQLL